MDRIFTTLRQRSALFKAIRHYFDVRGYLEVETPLLSPSPIPESTIELFRTEGRHPSGGALPLYLLPSPELWMKRLLAQGSPSIYQISRCFRNGEQIDTWHRFEFSMLEWYRLGIEASENLPAMEDLIHLATEACGNDDPALKDPIRRISMEDAFREFAGFSLENDLRESGLSELTLGDPDYFCALSEAGRRLSGRLESRSLPVGEGESVDDLFHRLFLTLVEDELPKNRPLAITHWPALVPTLARRIPGTPWSDRWELYLRGVEVANCYGEETSKQALVAYWDHEAPLKAAAAIPVRGNRRWLEEVDDKLPRCSGAAVGLDRLLALAGGLEGLQGLDLFPLRDMIGGSFPTN